MQRKKKEKKPIKLKKRANNNKILDNQPLLTARKLDLFVQSFQIYELKQLAAIFQSLKLYLAVKPLIELYIKL